MDTGLGRDGYSIIGQGRIDEILSLKSEDRREIFEEAAGVTKFRYRKEEAARKLAATEENLVRIRDLYTELAHQAEPLAEQAEKAKQYMELRDELRTWEVSLWLDGLTKLRADTEKNQDTADCAAQLNKARTEQDRLYAQSEQLTKELRDADAAADDLRQQMHTTEQNRAELSSRCAVLEANLKNNAQNRERIQKEQARQAEQARSLAEQAAVHLARQAELAAACETLAQTVQQIQLEDAQAGAQAESLQQERSAIDARKAKNEQTRFEAELARTAAKTGLSGMDSRKEYLAVELEQAAAQLAEQTAVCKISENKLETCRQEQETLKNQRAGMTLKIERRQTKVQECVQTLADITAKQTDIENRIQMLRELEKDYEGFSHAVKRVMQQAGRGTLTGIHGPVSTCLTVQSRYVTAIEIALGAAGSHLIVDTAMDGKAAIAYLKRTDSGRATFLPLDTIRAKPLDVEGLDTCAGVCGTADTLISCAPEYQTVMQSLLARTVIAEDMDTALALAKKYHHHFRIVTLDGQMIQAGGAMTGGSVSKTSGILARTAQLHTLTEQAEQLKAAQTEAEQILERARTELSQVQSAYQRLENEQQRQQEQLTALQTELAQSLARTESLRTQYENLSAEHDSLDTARTRYEQEILSAQQTLTVCAQEQEALQSAFEQIQHRFDDWTQAQKLRMTKIHELHTAQAQNRAELAAEQRAAEHLERLHADMEAGADNSAQMLEQLEQEAQLMQEQLAQAGDLRDNGADDLKRLQELLAAQAQQRMRIEAQRTQTDRRAQEQNDEILGLERETVRLSAQGVQLKNEEAQILDKMWESYELTPTPAQAFRIELPDHTAAQRTAEQLRGQLRALGNVNLDAVEAYAALRERFLFLEEQKEDLETAQKELQTVIDELTVHMKEIFAAEFAKLNHYFGQTFTEIFGGGHAQLELADTTDILNCGIEIRVCLPGKAVKTLTLLSGGEKAFVAIALYFAILKVRPTPFCVLDEIEAALDDVNVARYAQYLRRLSDATQFIAITHRRGTMEQADMLYGVTMQEQGVSRMLMLNLAEAEEKFQGTIN